MRLAPSRIAAFLQRPEPEIRAVLLYGQDEGLVRERAEAVARSVCPDLGDPFRVADLMAAVLAADPARLADEAAQLSLIGGRRVVRVRGAGDSLAKLFAEFLESTPGEALVVVEAGELPSRSTLRRAFEAARSAVAIGCYPDTARELAAVIRETLAAHRVSASRDAGQFLVDHLGGDRLLTRSELEKLALYAGEGGRVELEDARLSVSDTAALELDDAVMAAAEGDAGRVERVLGRVLQQGESPVSIIRALLRHLHRLHALTARLAAGASVDEVLRTARPPIFFKQEDSFRRQLGLWTETRLRPLLARVAKAELNMKTTGFPAETICREVMLAVTQLARDRRR
ncbi:MAG: DNA polymerase III subunit delta [Alphaproteobacteria bacterium]|nr:DNA polymerase III subunit delta [Alphaproteobacteria bacterium]